MVNRIRQIVAEVGVKDVMHLQGEWQTAREFAGEKLGERNFDQRFEQIAGEDDPDRLRAMIDDLLNDPMGRYLRMELEQMLQFATEPTEPILEEGVASYVLWRLFKEQWLRELGILDETFAKCLKYTNTEKGGHLSFASYRGGKLVVPQELGLDETKRRTLEQWVEREMGELFYHLLPAINYQVGHDAVDEKMPFRKRALTDRTFTGLAAGPGGEVISKLPDSHGKNESAQRYFEEGSRD